MSEAKYRVRIETNKYGNSVYIAEKRTGCFWGWRAIEGEPSAVFFAPKEEYRMEDALKTIENDKAPKTQLAEEKTEYKYID